MKRENQLIRRRRLNGVYADYSIVQCDELKRNGSLVRQATRLLKDPDGPSTLSRIVTRHGRQIGAIPPIGILAMEMAASEAREKRLLRLEAAELDFRWKREEELASVMDRDLTPVPLLSTLLREIRGDRRHSPPD